jgi:diguanylate cyclase (GGDEF)-like protein
MKRIVVVSQDIVLKNLAERILSGPYEIVAFNDMKVAMDYIYSTIPELVIADIHKDDRKTIDILNTLKADPMFNPLPVLVVMDEVSAVLEWGDLMIEDYMLKPDLQRDLLTRASLSIVRSERVVEVNPLTRLPGNISIYRQIQGRLERTEPFALAYADIDNFKPFNDKYGFGRGDEVIKMTGRIILNMVRNRQSRGSFIGHIGGDDFIYIMDISRVEQTTQEIIEAFERLIPKFYDPDDSAKGYIQSLDRRGNSRSYLLMGLSIGVTDTGNRDFFHHGEMIEAASEMKKYAKQLRGSCYRMDKRREPGTGKAS